MSNNVINMAEVRRQREEKTITDLEKIANDPDTNPVTARAIRSLIETYRMLSLPPA